MSRANVFLKFLVMGCLIFGAASFCYAANLFVDPNFDNGIHSWSQDGYPFNTNATEVHSAPYSATNVITTVTDQDYFGEIYQVIPYAAGEPVYMSGWLKTNLAVGSTARAGIQVEFLNSSGQPIPNTTIKTDMGGVNNWFQIYVTGTAPVGTVNVRAGVTIFAKKGDNAAVGGQIYADDCFIDKITLGGLINNTGFESQISGWTTGNGTYPFDITTAEKHSGTYSASDLVDTVAGSDYYGFIYQTITPAPGYPIYASAWGKSDISELSSAVGGLIIEFRNAAGVTISKLESKIGGRTDWRQLYVSGVVPSGTIYARVGGYLWAGAGDTAAVNGKFYIDDFVVSASEIPPPPPQSGLINGNFENGVNDWATLFRPWQATDTIVHSGSFSAYHNIGDTDGSSDYYTEIYQEIPYQAGKSAYLTGWVRVNKAGNHSSVGGIKIGFYNASGTLIPGSEAKAEINENINFFKFMFANKIAPAGTAKLRISGYAWAAKNQGTLSDAVYLDDIMLSDTPPSDLILNPGFENALSGWTLDSAGTPMVYTNEDKRSGSYSAKATIQQPTGGADYWSRTYQEFDFPAQQDIYATLWARTNINPASHGVAGLKVEFLNSAGNPIGTPEQDIIGGQTGWTYLYANGLSPIGTTKVRISCFASCPNADAPLGGTAYFDDVIASFDPLPQPIFPTDISNAGFETGLNPWTDLYGLPSQVVSEPHSGSNSLKKTIGTTPNADYYSITYQDIYYNNQASPFPTAQDVYLTAYVKSNINPAADAAGGIKIEYFDNNDVAHEIGRDQVSAINNWRKLYVKASIPAGAKKLRVMGFAWAKQNDALSVDGTVNFDDFVYSYAPLTPPPISGTLLNPGFENGLNDWDIPFKPAFVETNPSIVYSGNYAAGLLIDDVSQQNYDGQIRQDVAVIPGKIVTARVWAKTAIEPMSSAKAKLYIVFSDANGMFITMGGSLQELGGNTGWTQLSVRMTAPANAARVNIRLELFAPKNDGFAVGGKAYFDAATLSITSSGGGGGMPRKIPAD